MDKRFQILAVLKFSSLVMVPILALALYVVLSETEKGGPSTAEDSSIELRELPEASGR